MIKIKKGLTLPIDGRPQARVETSRNQVQKVAVMLDDYIGLRARLRVQEGDQVKIGSPIWVDKSREEVVISSPGAGKVVAINRGERRALQSVVIELSAGEEYQQFSSYSGKKLEELGREDITSLMLESGMWSALRTRPYSKIPDWHQEPNSIFVTAMDTNPLTFSPELMINDFNADFQAGLAILSRLTHGKLFVCVQENAVISILERDNIEIKRFGGIHPAGNVGTHIHFLDPVSAQKTVWHINYQDVIALGNLFVTGKLLVTRYLGLGGPGCLNPRVLITRLGASLPELLQGELTEGNQRIISGSVFNGHHAMGPYAYLGRFHCQISVLPEGGGRHLWGWIMPGLGRFSVTRTLLSSFLPRKKSIFNCSTNGSVRAIVPIGLFEKVIPLDILPTQLLLALSSCDTDQAQRLGCLELAEEDLALCTFVCPGKNDYGKRLRENLVIIEKEG